MRATLSINQLKQHNMTKFKWSFSRTYSNFNVGEKKLYFTSATWYRSTRADIFRKKGSACNFIKKETLAEVFSYEFCEISKNTFSYITPLVAASADSLPVVLIFSFGVKEEYNPVKDMFVSS